MTWKVEWPKNHDIQSFGRNRGALMTGLAIQVYEWTSHRLILKPINSRSAIGEGCTLELPLDHLDALIAVLIEIRKTTAGEDSVRSNIGGQ